HLAVRYGPGRLKQRAANKREIEKRFALEPGDGMVFAVVSRLTWQKGMDLLAAAIDGLVASGARLAVLGSGEAALEDMFRVAAAGLEGALKRALRLYADREAWESLQKRGMKHDVSWNKGAARFAGIYKSLADGGSG